MKNKFLMSIICLLCLLISLSNSALAKEQPTIAGAYTEEEKQSFTDFCEENNKYDAAVSVSVVSKEGVLYKNSVGYADKEKGIAADENTVYEWGSLSKVLTWISVMQLWEEDKIDLEEDIRVYLPEDFFKKLSYNKKITMLDLMNHTGGFQDSISNVYTNKEKNILPLAEYIRENEPIQLYEPGTTVAYSNWGTALAGYIVERVSGEEYCDYVTSHILKPLKMEHTSIEPLHQDNLFVLNGLQEITGYAANGKEIKGHYYAPDYPAAGAAGTIGDVEHLIFALLGNKEYLLFQKENTLSEMLSVTNTLADSSIPENAHGLWFDFYQETSLGHYGNTPQFSTHMSIMPTKQLGMIVMTNQAQEMKINHGFGELVFGSKTEESAENKGTALKFHKYYTGARTIEKGFCRFYHYFQIYTVKETGENSILLSSPFMKIPCTKIGENTYRATEGMTEGYLFVLQTDTDGMVSKIATSTFDIIPYSTRTVMIDTISFLMAAAALVVSVILLIISLYQICKKKKEFCIVAAVNGMSFLFLFTVILESMKLATTAAARNDMVPYILFYLFYFGIGIFYLFYFVLQKKKNIILILTLSASCVLMAFLIYWQMFFL